MKSSTRCSFIGHRKINGSEELKSKLYNIIEDLILNKNVTEFLFGSRSDFDNLCHVLVTNLKEKYPHIQRLFYTCKNDGFILESEREKEEKTYSQILKKPISLRGFEKEVEHKTKYTAGKASYVERNRAIIDDSDYCIFYYDENYLPDLRQYSKDSIYYQPKSGTKLAYEYAKRKNKVIINVKELI